MDLHMCHVNHANIYIWLPKRNLSAIINRKCIYIYNKYILLAIEFHSNPHPTTPFPTQLQSRDHGSLRFLADRHNCSKSQSRRSKLLIVPYILYIGQLSTQSIGHLPVAYITVAAWLLFHLKADSPFDVVDMADRHPWRGHRHRGDATNDADAITMKGASIYRYAQKRYGNRVVLERWASNLVWEFSATILNNLSDNTIGCGFEGRKISVKCTSGCKRIVIYFWSATGHLTETTSHDTDIGAL